jgi:hypothetical protein
MPAATNTCSRRFSARSQNKSPSPFSVWTSKSSVPNAWVFCAKSARLSSSAPRRPSAKGINRTIAVIPQALRIRKALLAWHPRCPQRQTHHLFNDSHLTPYLAHPYHGHCSFALAFHVISPPIWNLVPINVSINQGSGVCLSTSYPTLCSLCSHLCLHCRTFCLLRHCHSYPSQRYPPKLLQVLFLPFIIGIILFIVLVLSFVCDKPGNWPSGYVFDWEIVFVCVFVLPHLLSLFSYVCLIFAFHLISFVALRVRIGSFGNSVLPFIIIAFEGVNHIGEHICDWFTGAILPIHCVVYYHSIGTWDFSFFRRLSQLICQFKPITSVNVNGTRVKCIICLYFYLTPLLLPDTFTFTWHVLYWNNTFSRTTSSLLTFLVLIYISLCMTVLYVGSCRAWIMSRHAVISVNICR